MSVKSAAALLSAGMSVTTEQAARPLVDLAARRRRDAQRRRINVAVLRVLVAVVFLGSWEILARLGWIDPFFTSQPSAVADKLWYWITQGTELGPLWEQALVTMEEAGGGWAGSSSVRSSASCSAWPSAATGCCPTSSGRTSRARTQSLAWCSALFS